MAPERALGRGLLKMGRRFGAAANHSRAQGAMLSILSGVSSRLPRLNAMQTLMSPEQEPRNRSSWLCDRSWRCRCQHSTLWTGS
jgi:hypothetical protein